MSTPVRPAIAHRSLHSVVALAFGAVFVLVGLSGFAVSGGQHTVGGEGGELLGLFQVNVLHNLVHLAAGAALVVAGILGARQAKLANTTFGAIYLVVAVLGLFITGTAANIIALNGADNILHLVLGSVLLADGLRADHP